MKESERLKDARALIADEKSWMQGDYYDMPGRPEESTCFCSLGAVRRTYVDEGMYYSDASRAVGYLEAALHTDSEVFDEGGVATFNDTHPHEHVLYLFDKAIELAEAEGC